MMLLLSSFARIAHAQQPIAIVPLRIDALTYVDVAINGVRASLVLDTGAPGIAIDPRLAQQVHLRAERADSVRIGDVLLKGEPVRVRSFAAVNDPTSGRPPVLGVVGNSFLRPYVARFDFAAQSLALFDARTFSYAGAGVVVPLAIVDDKPIVRASLGRTGRTSVDARLFLDAGTSGAPIALTPAFARVHGILGDGVPQLELAGGRTLYGGGADRVTRLPTVTLGMLTIPRPLVTVSDALGAAIAPSLADGTIGLPVLSRTTMLLDYLHGRAIFEPSPGFEAPYTFPNVSGLQLQRRSGALVVHHVIATSPADSAGIRVGDEIVSVDDATVPDDGSATLPQLRAIGTTHRVTIRRAGVTQTVSVTLRALI